MTDMATVQGKRILLAEDEPTVRESIKLMLYLDRHTVIEASNGREALALYSPDRFDLVITDYLMPEMYGDELARNIQRVAPYQPILMVTAYFEQLLSSDKPVDAVLGKPVALDELRQAVAARFQNASHSLRVKATPEGHQPLSPQKLRDRATTKSRVLNEILERRYDTSFYRGWGIND